jgi:hypothetical protein
MKQIVDLSRSLEGNLLSVKLFSHRSNLFVNDFEYKILGSKLAIVWKTYNFSLIIFYWYIIDLIIYESLLKNKWNSKHINKERAKTFK